MRNVLAHAGKSGRRVVSAFIATAFAQETLEAASIQWRAVADQIRPKAPKLAAILDDAEPNVLAYMTFPKEHRAKLHSTNPIERLNGEIKRRTDVVGIFPNDNSRSSEHGTPDAGSPHAPRKHEPPPSASHRAWQTPASCRRDKCGNVATHFGVQVPEQSISDSIYERSGGTRGKLALFPVYEE